MPPITLNNPHSDIAHSRGIILGSLLTKNPQQQRKTSVSLIDKIDEIDARIEELESEKGEHNSEKITACLNELRHYVDRVNAQTPFDEVATPVPLFETALMSPVDMTRSVIHRLESGVESVRLTSQFIRSEHIITECDQIARRIAAVHENKHTCISALPNETDLSQLLQTTIRRKTHRQTMQGTVIISAYVATRVIQTVSPLYFNKDRLKTIESLMSEKSSDSRSPYDGIYYDSDGQASIRVITEAHIGGLFLGFAHIFDHTKNQKTDSNTPKEKHLETMAQIELDVLSYGVTPKVPSKCEFKTLSVLHNLCDQFIQKLTLSPSSGCPISYKYTTMTRSNIQFQLSLFENKKINIKN